MKKRVQAALLAIAASSSPLAHSAITKCDAADQKPFFTVQWVAFDIEKGTAQMQFGDEKRTGRITYVRTHDGALKKYNLVFPSPYSFHAGSARMELMLFPIRSNEWLLGGAVTIVVDGQRHIDLLVAPQDMRCQTLTL